MSRKSRLLLGIALMLAGLALGLPAAERASADRAAEEPARPFPAVVTALDRDDQGRLASVSATVKATAPEHALWKDWLATAQGASVHVTVTYGTSPGDAGIVSATTTAVATITLDFPGELKPEPSVGGPVFVWY